MKLRIACTIALAVAALAPPAALPQSVPASAAESAQRRLSGFWTVSFERERSGQALIDELPDGAVLIDDGGAGELEAGDYGGLELTARAVEQIESYDFADELTRENTCNPPSAVFYMQAPFPMEIHAGRDLIVFRMEYFDMVRIVFMDGRGVPDGVPLTKSGYSVGRWDGDTLVVETSRLAPGTFMNNGFDHSENIRMVERFRLSPDGDTLWATQLYEDPEVFEGRAARYIAWSRVPGEHVYPYDCDPSYGR